MMTISETGWAALLVSAGRAAKAGHKVLGDGTYLVDCHDRKLSHGLLGRYIKISYVSKG